jgi:hypothetical protein
MRPTEFWEPYEATSRDNYKSYEAPPSRKTYRKLWLSCLTWKLWKRTKWAVVQIPHPGRTDRAEVTARRLLQTSGLEKNGDSYNATHPGSTGPVDSVAWAMSDVSRGRPKWLYELTNSGYWLRTLEGYPLRRPLNPNAPDFHRGQNEVGFEPRQIDGNEEAWAGATSLDRTVNGRVLMKGSERKGQINRKKSDVWVERNSAKYQLIS